MKALLLASLLAAGGSTTQEYGTALHEAGHVLVAMELSGCIHPFAVSIDGTEGRTDFQFNKAEPACLDDVMTVGAAGFAAELLVLRQSRTGSEMDFMKSVRLAADMTMPQCEVNPHVYEQQCMDEGIGRRMDRALNEAYSILSLHQDELLRIARDIYSAGFLELGDPPTGCF
ncbi:MAG: hypothetical protein AAB692_04335 [Patescibacteria group bacterium]